MAPLRLLPLLLSACERQQAPEPAALPAEALPSSCAPLEELAAMDTRRPEEPEESGKVFVWASGGVLVVTP